MQFGFVLDPSELLHSLNSWILGFPDSPNRDSLTTSYHQTLLLSE